MRISRRGTLRTAAIASVVLGGLYVVFGRPKYDELFADPDRLGAYPERPDELTERSAIEYAVEYEQAQLHNEGSIPDRILRSLSGSTFLAFDSGYLIKVTGGGSVSVGNGHGDIFIEEFYYVGEQRLLARIPVWRSEREGQADVRLTVFNLVDEDVPVSLVVTKPSDDHAEDRVLLDRTIQVEPESGLRTERVLEYHFEYVVEVRTSGRQAIEEIHSTDIFVGIAPDREIAIDVS